MNEQDGLNHEVMEVAARFLEAIVWGEHLTVWELLSQSGKAQVLEAGERRGLDAVLAARLRQGTSSQEESDVFLTGLLQGLRVDFSAVDLNQVKPASITKLTDQRVEIHLECPAVFGPDQWAAGSLILSATRPEQPAEQPAADQRGWLVDRVLPVVSRST